MYENNLNDGHSADVIYPPQFHSAAARLQAMMGRRFGNSQTIQLLTLTSKLCEWSAALAGAIDVQADRMANPPEKIDVARIYTDLVFIAEKCRENEKSLKEALGSMFPLGQVGVYQANPFEPSTTRPIA